MNTNGGERLFGPEFFRLKVRELTSKLEKTPSLLVHLVNGRKFTVFSFAEIVDGYIILEVYTEEDTFKHSFVAVGYESISEVEVTTDKQKEANPIGFHFRESD